MAQITVDYVEMTENDSLSEGNDENGGWARKKYGVNWEDRILFARQVMGGSTMSGGIGGSWNRKFPLQYPDDPTLYAKSVDIKPVYPWIEGSVPLAFKQAIVTVNFRAPSWDYNPSESDPLFLNSFSQDASENEALANCTQSISFAAEYDELPGSNAVYEDGTKLKTPIFRRIMVARMVLNYHKLPFMPLARIFTYADVLNDDKFLGRPRGTVLLEGASTDRKREADGTATQDITISLKTRKNDWNERLKPDGSWSMVYLGLSGGLPDTTKTALEYVDMKPLLFIGS